MSQKIALCVGVNEYADPENNLNFAVNDARSIAEIFSENGYKTELLCDAEATSGNIKKRLEELAATLKEDDFFFFYFSGHGAEFSARHLLICNDFDSFNYDASLTLNNVSRLTAVKGCTRLFIIDTCRVLWDTDSAKAAGNDRRKKLEAYIRDIYEREMRSDAKAFNNDYIIEPIIMTSCASGETSMEMSAIEHGYFTNYLLKVLKKNNSHLTLNMLTEQLGDIIAPSAQHPAISKPMNSNPLIFGTPGTSKENPSAPGSGFFSGWFSNDKAEKNARQADDVPVFIRKIAGNPAKTEVESIYNLTSGNLIHLSVDAVKKLKKTSGENYFVSTGKFFFELDTTLRHEDCPGGLRVKAILQMKLVPCAEDFGNFLRLNPQEVITLPALKTILQRKEFGIAAYLQKIINGVANAGLLIRHGQEAVAWCGQDELLPPWLCISNIQSLTAEAMPTLAEKRCKEFNAEQNRLAESIARKQQQLDYENQLNDIEENRKDIDARNAIRAIERQNSIELAKIQQEYELEKLKSDTAMLKINEEIAIASRNNLQLEKEKAELEKQKISESITYRQKRMVALLQAEEEKQQQNREIHQRQLQLEETRIAETEAKKNNAEKEAELLAIQIEKEKANIQNLEIQRDISLAKAKQENDLLTKLFEQNQNFLEQFISRLEQHFSTLQGINTKMVNVFYGAPATDSALARQIRKQMEKEPVKLTKEGLQFQCQELRLHGKQLQFDSDIIRIGQYVKLHFTAPRSGYLTLLNIDSAGKATILSPNFIDGNVCVERGKQYDFPSETDRNMLFCRKIYQQGPTGKEQMLIIISDRQLFHLPVIGELAEMSEIEQKNFAEVLDALPPEQWAAGYLDYIVAE